METAWNNVKIDVRTLIEILPSLLHKVGQYVYFGVEPDHQPYTISRAVIDTREVWVITECDDFSHAFVIEVCREVGEETIEEAMNFLYAPLGIEATDDIWVTEKVFNPTPVPEPAEILEQFNREIPDGDSLELVQYAVAKTKQ